MAAGVTKLVLYIYVRLGCFGIWISCRATMCGDVFSKLTCQVIRVVLLQPWKRFSLEELRAEWPELGALHQPPVMAQNWVEHGELSKKKFCTFVEICVFNVHECSCDCSECNIARKGGKSASTLGLLSRQRLVTPLSLSAILSLSCLLPPAAPCCPCCQRLSASVSLSSTFLSATIYVCFSALSVSPTRHC